MKGFGEGPPVARILTAPLTGQAVTWRLRAGLLGGGNLVPAVVVEEEVDVGVQLGCPGVREGPGQGSFQLQSFPETPALPTSTAFFPRDRRAGHH